MLKKILLKWNFQRLLFALMGTFVVIESFINKQWWGVLFGAYFAVMGIFGLGCASSNCFSSRIENKQTSTVSEDVEFEEVKTLKK